MEPITIFLVSLFALISSSEFLLKNIIKYSRKIKMEVFFIGSVVLALSTSLPELFNGINAVLLGHGEIALGDIVGSCIANFGFVLGTLTLFRPFRIKREERYFVRVSILSFLLLLLSLLDGTIESIEGMIFLITFLLYYLYSFLRKRRLDVKEVRIREIYPELIKISLFLFFVILSSNLLIKASVEISKILLVPTSVIGLSLIAFSTSFPEITIAILSSVKKQQKLSFGDIVGSNILNILLVVGIISLISPIKIKKEEFLFPIIIYILILTLVWISTDILKRFERRVGFILLSSYLFYMAGLPTFR